MKDLVDDAVKCALSPVKAFAKDSTRFVNRCQKPDRREFTAIACRTAVGFAVMGFVGFFVKLIFIPINSYITGATL